MKKLSVILIFIGVILIAIPVLGQIMTYYQQKAILQEWVEDDTREESAEVQDDKSLNHEERAESQKSTPKEPAKKQPSVAKKIKRNVKVLGMIKIKKLNLQTLVVKGAKKSDLRVGVGLIPGTAGIGAPGNSALAGHRSYTFGKFFSRINELSAGDEIIIETKAKTYKYKVYERLIVKPSDVWVLNQNKKEKIITLITCHPIYIATERLIVRARLIE